MRNSKNIDPKELKFFNKKNVSVDEVLLKNLVNSNRISIIKRFEF